MPAQWQTWPYALPRTVPEACPPIGNDEALRMEGFFASCGPPPAQNELRGESSTRAHPNYRTCLTETGARHAGPPARHQAARQGIPQPEYPARVSDRPASPRRSGPAMRQQPPGSPTSPSGIAARYPQTRLHFPTFAQDGPLHGERPALRRACSQTYQRAPPLNPPLHRRKAPSHTSRGIPVARKQARARERKNSGIFSPQFSPSLLFPAP